MIGEKERGFRRKTKTSKVIEALNRDQRVRSWKSGDSGSLLGGSGLSSGDGSWTSSISQGSSCDLSNRLPHSRQQASATFVSETLRGNEDMGTTNPLFEDDRRVLMSPFLEREGSLSLDQVCRPLQGRGRRASTNEFLSGIAVIAPDKVTDMEKAMNLSSMR